MSIGRIELFPWLHKHKYKEQQVGGILRPKIKEPKLNNKEELVIMIQRLHKSMSIDTLEVLTASMPLHTMAVISAYSGSTR